MNNFYIYTLNYIEKEKGLESSVSATIIFCDRNEINEDSLKEEISKYYEQHYQTDKMFIIGGEYIKDLLIEVFIERQNNTFKGIPKRQDTHLSENIFLCIFNKIGELICINEKNIPDAFQKKYLNEGLQNIFINRGGLITSQGAHHYIFPSGKHCDKFLRTGNILLVSSEIYFIAFALLKHFDETKYNQIYCDTSSINSVAFALIELKGRFIKHQERKQIPIESFSSYDGLYKKEFTYGKDAFLLISASTSSNIIAYILENHKIIDRDNIIIMYFLGEEKSFANIKDQVLCNLTHSKNNLNGIPSYKTFKEENCEYCKSGSFAVAISGDVFLLDSPKINKIILKVTDAEKNLSEFVDQFKSIAKTETILKVNYKEYSEFNYEVYFNFYEILTGIDRHSRFNKYKQKLNDYINQYIPSSTKYIISLNDSASNKLSEYILNKISKNYTKSKRPPIVTQDNINNIVNVEGTVVVVGSCISNGKNLLYISRALRRYNRLRIVYFIGISRTKNKEYLNFLKGNLKQGNYGSETNSFIEVETIFCNNDSKSSSWVNEIKFLRSFIDFVQDEIPAAGIAIEFLKKRKKILEEGSGEIQKGLSENLFYPRITGKSPEELNIRKNFAFFNFEKYDKDVTQSDIYFTISNIINSLRNSEKSERNLKQSLFIRNIIVPANFNRYNDGIIQASILRSANPDELSFIIDHELSEEMYNTLETLVKYHQEEHGEALLEFIYAIAIKKMTLKKSHLQRIIALIDEKCKDEIFKCFTLFIKKTIIEENKPLLLS